MYGFEVESVGPVRVKNRQRKREVDWEVMDETAHEDECECDR